MTKRLSSAALVALQEAHCTVYWYKADLRSFLQQCLSNPAILTVINWENYKRQIVADVVNYLTRDQDKHLGDLTKLCYEVCSITSFRHLEALDGEREKAERARQAVQQLRQLVESHDDSTKEEEAIVERRRQHTDKMKANVAVRQKLDEINQHYMSLVTSTNPQGRGFQLEKVMYDLFELFDLDPKASFRNVGEQIDGAFSLESIDYLFEAKWQAEPVGASDLDGFAAKVDRKLENTLGVFLAINGFSEDGVKAHSARKASILLMDGADLMAVLEERIDFVTLLHRKKRHAAQTGDIYLRIHQVLS